MKKLLIALFSVLVLSGCAKEPEVIACYDPLDAYAIDPVATANAPWVVGEKMYDDKRCHFGDLNRCYDIYGIFLGITEKKFFLVQEYYYSGEKFSDPHLTGEFRNGLKPINGDITEYYKNGQKMRSFTFEFLPSSEVIATMETWYENGQNYFIEQRVNGVKSGIWRTWDENGNLIEEIDYGTP